MAATQWRAEPWGQHAGIHADTRIEAIIVTVIARSRWKKRLPGGHDAPVVVARHAAFSHRFRLSISNWMEHHHRMGQQP